MLYFAGGMYMPQQNMPQQNMPQQNMVMYGGGMVAMPPQQQQPQQMMNGGQYNQQTMPIQQVSYEVWEQNLYKCLTSLSLNKTYTSL